MTTAPIRVATSLPARTFALEVEVPSSAIVWPAVGIAIEGACMHLLMASTTRPAMAWVVTSLNASALLWFWSAHRAICRARLVLRDDFVEVRAWRGFRCRTPRSNIERVERAAWESMPDVAPDFLDVSGRGEPNVIIRLRPATEVRLAPGISKAVSRIGLRVKDAAGVLALVDGTP